MNGFPPFVRDAEWLAIVIMPKFTREVATFKPQISIRAEGVKTCALTQHHFRHPVDHSTMPGVYYPRRADYGHVDAVIADDCDLVILCELDCGERRAAGAKTSNFKTSKSKKSSQMVRVFVTDLAT
jgi:hypothetical protein